MAKEGKLNEQRHQKSRGGSGIVLTGVTKNCVDFVPILKLLEF